MRKLPFTKGKLEEIASKWPTPFYVYDAAAIRENARRLKKAFGWNRGFREYFAVKATPNPHLLKMLSQCGFGADCSSLAELVLSKRAGITGENVMFTSNDTPAEEFREAWRTGAIVNFDDVTHWEYFLDAVAQGGTRPGAADFDGRVFCCRYNPGPLKGGNAIIGRPEEAKYGMPRDQLFRCYEMMRDAGVKRFGLHTMVASNELDPEYIIDTAKMLFDIAADVSRQLGVVFEFVNIGGGVGIPYKPGDRPMNLEYLGRGIEAAYRECVLGRGMKPLKIFMECGRCITGPYGYLVARVLHIKRTYRLYAGLDACMANLMRPAIYGAYHEIVVPGKESSGDTTTYDVTGSLCENNDKFAVQRVLPLLERGDFVVICDAGAHGHSMGFQYNGKLRSAELLLESDGSVREIRRAETLDDYFATLDFDGL